MDELSTFIHRVWSSSYSGHMTFPNWTGEYLQWQLGADANRENLLAAYDGDRLAGVLLGADRRMRTAQGPLTASQWSWLSVAQEYQGRHLSKALDEERVRRQRARGTNLILSFRYVGSRHSKAERPNTQNSTKRFHSKLGFWARILDADTLAQWHTSTFEGQLAKWTKWLSPRVFTSPQAPVRELQPKDLLACLDLLKRCQLGTALCIDWDETSLQHQLFGSPLSQSLVIHQAERIVGLLNYHTLPFTARTVANVAVIDMISIHPDSHSQLSTLLQAALTRMKTQGVMLALKLRSGDVPVWPLLRTGFIPQPADSFLVLQGTQSPIDIPQQEALQLLWR